jgi:hypothetical protein
MMDLNSLIGNSSFTLIYANDINDYGVIVGGAEDSKNGTSPGFVAIPFPGAAGFASIGTQVQ